MSAAAPYFSIVIPAYNVAAYIGTALDSVFAQTCTDYEAIVVNDGSPDTEDLERALAPYRERIIYITQQNRGFGGAVNAGIRAASGRYLALLGPDDYWEPNNLQAQRQILAEDPSIDILYGDARVFGNRREQGRSLMESCPSTGEANFEALLTLKCIVIGSAAVIRREVFDRSGLFDESLRGSAEDFDMWLRIAKLGGRIVYHRKPLVHYRRRANSLTADGIKVEQGALQVLEKVERTMDLTPREAQVLQGMLSRVRARLAWQNGRRALLEKDAKTAGQCWGEANRHYRSVKLWLMVRLLSLAPNLFVNLYHRRSLLRQTSIAP